MKLVILSLANHKAPGPDGFTNEVYKHSVNLVAQPLCDLFEEVLINGFLPLSLSQANFVFLLKKDKDKLNCESHRPIALINTDTKILARGVANRLMSLMDMVISRDQEAFIQGDG